MSARQLRHSQPFRDLVDARELLPWEAATLETLLDWTPDGAALEPPPRLQPAAQKVWLYLQDVQYPVQ